ncbi:MAG: rRNA pseudouridine synthase [Oligoflexia bacterium]|nr:rRNA pseudouridine synthase [Oligoflexia bacterium]
MKLDGGLRLQKFIADCGIASRRKAEEMIADGLVTVNGRVIKEMGFKITPGEDAVKVNGKLLRVNTSEKVYLLFNKPTGVISSLHDPEERPTIKDFLVKVRERVFPVGRLDYHTEGLMILTNDGKFSQSIIHPEKYVTKTYLVKLNGKLNEEKTKRLLAGVTLAEGKVKALAVHRTTQGDQYDWYKVVLVEGRNQQVQRLFNKIGMDTKKIKRVAIGRLNLGELPRGHYRYLTEEDAFKALEPYKKI